MEKQREIPPNAAPAESVRDAERRIKALGLSFHDGAKAAGLSRNTGYLLLRGTGSLGSLRKLEDWLVKEEAKKGRPRGSAGRVEDELKEWAELGVALRSLDPRRFDSMLEGIRELVSAKQREQDVLVQMFRPNPDFGK